MPALSQDIAPRLNPIKRDLVLVVEYHPGEPISVALSRKAKISDFTDAKPLTPVSRPVASSEKLLPKNSEGTKTVKKPTKGLKVTFPNGKVIWYITAIETFVATIKEVGYERVAALGIIHAGYNLVGRDKRPLEPGHVWQHESDGWYIYSNIGNETKIEDLKLKNAKMHAAFILTHARVHSNIRKNFYRNTLDQFQELSTISALNDVNHLLI